MRCALDEDLLPMRGRKAEVATPSALDRVLRALLFAFRMSRKILPGQPVGSCAECIDDYSQY